MKKSSSFLSLACLCLIPFQQLHAESNPARRINQLKELQSEGNIRVIDLNRLDASPSLRIRPASVSETTDAVTAVGENVKKVQEGDNERAKDDRAAQQKRVETANQERVRQESVNEKNNRADKDAADAQKAQKEAREQQAQREAAKSQDQERVRDEKNVEASNQNANTGHLKLDTGRIRSLGRTENDFKDIKSFDRAQALQGLIRPDLNIIKEGFSRKELNFK